MPKFMQSLSEENYNKLNQIAKGKGINIQDLIRAVIVPEWLEKQKEKKKEV